MKKSDYILILLFTIVTFGCSDDEPLRKAPNVTYSVTAVHPSCLPADYYALALVDLDDKFEQVSFFSCKEASGTADLEPGDLLEIRMYSSTGDFDENIRYDIEVVQDGELHTFLNSGYPGIEYLVK